MERELWKIISVAINALDRRTPRGPRTHSIGRIVRVFLWAALHDRPTYWACDRRHWVGVRPPPALPDQSTMSRRLRQPETWTMIEQLIDRLGDALDDSNLQSLVRCLDGKPLPISRHRADPDATFGRGAGGMDRGYKLHAIFPEKNRPVAWSITPLNQSEPLEAQTLIDDRLSPGYLLADANYDSNALYEHAGPCGVRLLTPRRGRGARSLGHRRQSDYRRDAIDRLSAPASFARDVLQLRRRIETRFAHLTNFGGGLTCLPPWVRRLPRVRLWVAVKIIIRLAKDQLKQPRAA